MRRIECLGPDMTRNACVERIDGTHRWWWRATGGNSRGRHGFGSSRSPPPPPPMLAGRTSFLFFITDVYVCVCVSPNTSRCPRPKQRFSVQHLPAAAARRQAVATEDSIALRSWLVFSHSMVCRFLYLSLSSRKTTFSSSSSFFMIAPLASRLPRGFTRIRPIRG